MHKINLNPQVVERAVRRRGRLSMFESIDPRRTAFLVIDMQNWMIDASFPTALKYGPELIAPINHLADTLRELGGTVVWGKMLAKPQDMVEWSVFYDSVVANQRDMFTGAFAPGSSAAELHSDLHVHPGDIISEKSRFSCVLTQSSDLHLHLAERNIDTIIISGMVTNVCCESTARDAMMMNYKTVVVSDACAAHTDDEHNASLSNVLNMFADVRTTDEVVATLRRSVG